MITGVNNEKVMVIRYDGEPPITLTWKNERVGCWIDKGGFPVYITHKEHASILCTQKADRYRLYRSYPLDVKCKNEAGALKYKKISPWYYEEQVVQTGVDEENGEALYGKKVVWHEDVDGKQLVSPSVEFITGVKPAQEKVNPVLLATKNENEELKKQIKELMETVKELTSRLNTMDKDSKPQAPQSQNTKGSR